MIFFFSVDGAFWNDLIRLPICFVWETPRGVALCITAVVYCDTEVLGKRGSYTDYAAGWTTRNRVFFFPGRKYKFVVFDSSRRALGSTLHPMQWVPGFFFFYRGAGSCSVMLATHPHVLPKFRTGGAVPP